MNAISILSLIVSFGALFFSFLNFKRGKRFDSENHLYKAKLEIYSNIFSQIGKLISKIGSSIGHGVEFGFNKTTKKFEVLDKGSNEIHALIDEFYMLVVTNSLIMPSKIVNELGEFFDVLSEVQSIGPHLHNNEVAIEKLRLVNDRITEMGDRISVLLREDLKIEDLNISLYKRIK